MRLAVARSSREARRLEEACALLLGTAVSLLVAVAVAAAVAVAVAHRLDQRPTTTTCYLLFATCYLLRAALLTKCYLLIYLDHRLHVAQLGSPSLSAQRLVSSK